MAEYVNGTRKLSETILKLIGEGLGLEKEDLDVKLLGTEALRANYYPKCPNPSLTMGFMGHFDTNILTLLQQNVSGLQIIKDGKWLVVDPLPNAFFVLTGIELQIISNGKFKATFHQVATNAEVDRLSIGIFISKPDETAIEPHDTFLCNGNPPKYKDFSMEMYNKRIPSSGEVSLAKASQFALDSFLIKD